MRWCGQVHWTRRFLRMRINYAPSTDSKLIVKLCRTNDSMECASENRVSAQRWQCSRIVSLSYRHGISQATNKKKKKSRNEKRKTCWPVAVTSVHQKWNERFIPDSHDEIVRCVAVVATAMAQKTRRPIKMPSSFGWDPSEFGRSCILC